ncbi:MFS transporter [Streptomyces sp. ST2-7A]|uniref:MFS transporter n=1 Tax=Streptomyces sp. ST2-7A TaxID=2907214 RepID=UPI001F231AA4|nr:MFS transporter [Streptomyces sp. ST2-7A]MCE7078623.1 MFS transporter [Streptomyces sp. ST2-7A]
MSSASTAPTVPGATPVASRPPLMRMNLALFGIGLASFAMLFSTQSLLPEIAAGFGVRPDAATWTISAATIALALAVVPLSLLSERFGRRRTMTASVGAALALAFVIPFAPDLSTLVVLRALQGAAIAGIPASAVAYLSEELDGRAMAGAVGLFIAGNSVGGMTGRILSGWVAEGWGWRAGLASVTVLALIGVALYRALIPASRNFTARTLRLRPAAASLGCHLRNGLLLRLYAIGGLLMAAFSAVYTAIAFRLSEAPFDLSAGLIGSIFVIYLVGTCSSSITGPGMSRLGRRGALYIGIGAVVAGLLVSTIDHLAAVIVALVLITGGFFFGHAVASSSVGRTATEARAQASALYQVTYYLGASVGGLLGALTYHHARWDGTVAFSLIALLAAAGITLYATRRARREAAVAAVGRPAVTTRARVPAAAAS